MTSKKYPIGIQTFEEIVTDNYCYVDKTKFIYDLVSRGKVYFLSRPRRFGKSLFVSTLESYFQGRKDLFKGLEIEQFETKWNEYPILRFDFCGKAYLNENSLLSFLTSLLEPYEKQYSIANTNRDPDERFMLLIRHIFETTGKRVVILIDEYDKPMLDVITDRKLLERNRIILKGFFEVLKSVDKYLQFVLLTGVTKFSQVTIFSGLNQMKDISMRPEYDTICGITEQEVETFFHEDVELLAENIGETYERTLELLRQKYNGYHFSESQRGVYNPFSLLLTFDTSKFNDYWFQTGTPTYVFNLFKQSKLNITAIDGIELDADEFANYIADTEKPIPMMYQAGYLTIKKYDVKSQKYTLGYPNEEVRSAFLNRLVENYLPAEGRYSSSDCLRDLCSGNVEGFMTRFKSFVASIHYQLIDDNSKEKYYQTIFYLLFSLLGADINVEQRSSQGRMDAVIKTADYIYIFEFKVDGNVDEALCQIKDKHYADPYISDGRKIICIGANFTNKGHRLEGWKVCQ